MKHCKRLSRCASAGSGSKRTGKAYCVGLICDKITQVACFVRVAEEKEEAKKCLYRVVRSRCC